MGMRIEESLDGKESGRGWMDAEHELKDIW